MAESPGTVADAESDPGERAASDVSVLLQAWVGGDGDAGERLFQSVYAELKRCAARQLRGERAGHTLQTTALVHEVYGRLSDLKVGVTGKRHFMALAARIMRRVLVDYARAQGADKRGGEWQRLSIDVALLVPDESTHELIEIHEAIEALAAFDPDQAKLIELRFFGGYSIEEAAEVLEVSPATLKREWDLARAWLHRRLKDRPLT